jgi:hypothetical protein
MGTLEEVAQLISLAIAPVFLLTAVASTLTVFAGRLSRIVDRGRVLEARDGIDESVRRELLLLERRARLIYFALSLGSGAALLVCLFMTLAFAGKMFHFEAAKTVALFFMGALFSYTAAIVCLLREVFLAVTGFRLGIRAAAEPPGTGS